MIATATKHRVLHYDPESHLPSFGSLDFILPPELSASEPPEARGIERDGVRLMVSYRATDHIELCASVTLQMCCSRAMSSVLNTSGTLNAALRATDSTGQPRELHLSTHLPGDLWSVEVRQPDPEHGTTQPMLTAEAGTILMLEGGATATLLAPYSRDRSVAAPPASTRLWVASLQLPGPLLPYLERYGFPIRYSYVEQAWPNSYYQTVYATEKGSAEMPSAGRAWTEALITRLVARGVQVVPLLLHTGVASLEEHEPPYEEWYRVPAETARTITEARHDGRRIIAVGTTVVRALETVTDSSGTTYPGEGWTDEIHHAGARHPCRGRPLDWLP